MRAQLLAYGRATGRRPQSLHMGAPATMEGGTGEGRAQVLLAWGCRRASAVQHAAGSYAVVWGDREWHA